ncbi:hypothetical protein LIER_07068 [Lithospermum erythrorhizon]|uniref:WDR36/Utp21 C-terminal domain-containing protein n=1 Tax=Lithospermum erythrorhizon TaxID=34254 RepID=A0AAV3P6P4_LITER
MCFSEDGKWLLTSSMDGSLRIWDVISAGLIDVIQVDFCVTALSLSPNMDVLATTHVDQNGVYLWVNQAMFSGSTSANSYGSGKQIVKTNSPSASSAADTQDVDSVKGAVNPPQLQVSSLCSISSQQIPGFVTLSLLPKSQWQSLVSLDIIKARNKPIEPPKKPEKAPFFLPSIHSLSGEIQFQSGEPAIDEKDKDPEETKKNIRKSDSAPSKFWHSLQSAADANNFAAFTEYINSLSPSTVDLELRIIQIINDDDQELDKRPELHYIGLLLDYFIHEISCRNNFEFVQALIRLFFKIHGESIRRQSELQSKAMPLLEVQSAVWQPLNELFNSVNCMLRLHSNSYF